MGSGGQARIWYQQMSIANVSTTTTLTAIESSRLAELETTIDKGMSTFVAVGQALAEIRDQRLYRESHSTFEAYCWERWGWTRQHSNRVIGAASVARQLEPMGSIPVSERALRPVVKLPPAERSQVLELAKVKAGSGPVTTGIVKAAVAEVAVGTAAALRHAIARDEKPPTSGELRHSWEAGVVVGAQAALSALRDRPDFGEIAVEGIKYVLAELWQSTTERKAEAEQAVRLWATVYGAKTSPTDAQPAPDPDHHHGLEVVERDAHGPVVVRRLKAVTA